jgi:hypothetical protein
MMYRRARNFRSSEFVTVADAAGVAGAVTDETGDVGCAGGSMLPEVAEDDAPGTDVPDSVCGSTTFQIHSPCRIVLSLKDHRA